MSAVAHAVTRLRARVEGTVQGVGFRPHVYRLATELGLGGWVLNDERGVLLEVEGAPERVEAFILRLTAEAPPLASVQRVLRESVPPEGSRGFEIHESERSGEPAALVTPDSATCDDCLGELFDPADRRFRYPFINCTNCGPRFTIVRGVPYDRPLTTMASFPMCERCRREYEDPADRRFHAQPNACPECGPWLRLVDRTGAAVTSSDPIRTVAATLSAGLVVAVKGLGGFHLACVASDEPVVASLRARKQRESKPFALMVPSVGAARELVELSEEEEALLLGRERPIVLARRWDGAPVANAVAPGLPELGLMLPYSPLHHRLMSECGVPLVMTSGNVSDEPIAYRDHSALARLRGIADLFLLHNRPIHMRTDDSVVRVVHSRPLMLRRSRGYVPASIDLPLETPPLLACGAELKSTFCVAKGTRAWVGHHIGDLKNWETLRSFREGVEHFERLFAVAPERVVHDLHPDYLSTRYASEREGVMLVGVQHHHAHLAACLAEHGETGRAVGAIFDGSGYGTDGTVWGGEILVGDLTGFERVGHLWPARLPGGDRAAEQPWRMACAWLVEAFGDEGAALPGVDPAQWAAIGHMARSGFSSPLTTSVGRLFDAVAALSGVRTESDYEGHAAIELEAAAARAERGAYPFPGLDAREAIRAVCADLAGRTDPGVVSARFHNGLAVATAHACAEAAEGAGVDLVVLSGGVFQNRRLLEATAELLRAMRLRVLVPERLPPNDGGISYGQAAVAAA
ncbi:MAG TPA: carbamoyltransferase HypF [Thermoleophilaceae bacterium]